MTTSTNDLLDMTLDDLADAPSIELFPNGSHKVSVEFFLNPETPNRIRLQLTYVDLLELADPTAVSPKAGDKNSVFFSLKKKDGTANEIAQGQLKEILRALAPTFGGSSMKEVMENSKGAEVVVATKISPAKGDYSASLNVVRLEVV